MDKRRQLVVAVPGKEALVVAMDKTAVVMEEAAAVPDKRATEAGNNPQPFSVTFLVPLGFQIQSFLL